MLTLPSITAFFQVVLIDIAMAGDNIIVVGMAAAGLAPAQRHKAVWVGLAAATVLRIIFALFAVQLLRITGLLAAGGLLLLWVSWKMYEEIRHLYRMKHAQDTGSVAPETKTTPKKLSDAIVQIILADVSMSLDNVLGVAGVAREHIGILVAGLGLSVFLMGVASGFIARLCRRYPWVATLGLAVVLYTALTMMWDGGQDLLKHIP